MKFSRIALVTGALLAPVFAGCNSDNGANHGNSQDPSSAVGEIGLQLKLPSGQTISTATYDITKSSAAFRSGPVPLQNSNVIKFQIGSIPVGTGYAIGLTATTSTGVSCSADAKPFEIRAAQTTAVLLTLRCGSAQTVGTDAGNVNVNVNIEENSATCAQADGLTALPAEVNVGSSVDLTGYSTAPATLAWSVAPAAGGSFGSASAASTTFTCVAPGTHTVTLSVNSGATCPTTTDTVQITCTPIPGTPDAGPVTPDAGPVVPDAGPVVPDAGPIVPDAGPVVPDAGPVVPDAGPVVPDAGPVVPDAGPVVPDAGPVTPDAGPADAGPVVDSGPAVDPKVVACTTCRRNNCTAFNGIDLVSGCFTTPNADIGADPTIPDFIQKCIDTVVCAQTNGCGLDPILSGAGCYCGNKDIDTCNTGGPATDGSAKCVGQWQAAAGSASNPDVQARFSDFTYPSGWAYFLLDCDRQNCRDICTIPGAGVVP